MTRSRTTRRPVQAELDFKRRGGPREGAGRKPKGERPDVPHVARPAVSRHRPLHVTLRLCPGLPSLRSREPYRAVLRAILSARGRFGVRVVHYSVQSNHLHLIVEAPHRAALTRGMRGLPIRLALALNRAWGRRGRVFDDRPHEHPLCTPWEVRNALVYVLQNAHRHGIHQAGADPYSSGRWFDGWREGAVEDVRGQVRPVAPARSWLLRVGWRRHGLIGIDELPALR